MEETPKEIVNPTIAPEEKAAAGVEAGPQSATIDSRYIVINLTDTQKIGLAMLDEKISDGMAARKAFLEQAFLEQGGGLKDHNYNFNDRTKSFIMVS